MQNKLFFQFDNYLRKIAIVDLKNKKKFTYAKIKKEFDLLNFLNNKKSIIFLIGNNDYETIITYIYCLKNNLVPLLLDQNIDFFELENFIESYKPKYIFFKKNSFKKINNAKIIGGYGEYLFLKFTKKINYKISKDLALLLTTSGSTGNKKLVRLSYNNIFFNTLSIIEYFKLNGSDSTITTLPYNYSYGLSVINTHLQSGAKILLNTEQVTQRIFWNYFNNNKITGLYGVPSHFHIIKQLKITSFLKNKFKYAAVAGGSLDLPTLDYFSNLFRESNRKFYVMYGQTEASPRMTYLPPDMLHLKKGSIGIAIPGGKIYFNKSKKTISRTNPAELIYKGQNVCLGYSETYMDFELGDQNNGVLKTGDIGYQDADDYFYISGRITRISKILGIRLNLDDIEKIISNMGFKCACFNKNELIIIFTESKDTNEKIKNLISQRTKLHKKFFQVKFIDKIPVNNNGKNNYKKLEKIYERN